MTNLDLTRMETGPTETMGVLRMDGQIFCLVIEPPKRNNKVGESCIPTGRYLCKRYDSPKFKTPCLALYNVPGRTNIAIHYGNSAADTKGCLIVGAYSGTVNGVRVVSKSRATLKALMSGIRDICYLTIREMF